jgi:lysophospholipid acyltransferase
MGGLFETSILGLASSLGLPDDQIRCLIALLLTYPLSLPLQWHSNRKIYKLDPSSKLDHSKIWVSNCSPAILQLKQAYIIASSFGLLLFCFPHFSDILHVVGGCIGVYLWLALAHKFSPKTQLGGAWLLILSHISWSHLVRQWTDYGSYRFDHTAPQMVLVLKLTSISWNIHDGRVRSEKLNSRQKLHAIKFPHILEFLSYALYFGGLLVGPAFEFYSFQQFLTGDVFLPEGTQVLSEEERITSETSPELTENIVEVSMPSPIGATLQCMLISGVNMVGVMTLADKYSFARLIQDPSYLEIPVSIMDWTVKFFQLQLAGFAARLQYYAIWVCTVALSCIYQFILLILFKFPNLIFPGDLEIG